MLRVLKKQLLLYQETIFVKFFHYTLSLRFNLESAKKIALKITSKQIQIILIFEAENKKFFVRVLRIKKLHQNHFLFESQECNAIHILLLQL